MRSLLEKLAGSRGSQTRKDGEIAFEAGDFAAAERSFTETLANSNSILDNAERRSQVRLQLAESQRKQAKLSEAEQTLRVAIAEASGDRDRSIRATCLLAMSEILLEAGKFEAAEVSLQDAIAAESGSKKPDLRMIARARQRLAAMLLRSGRTAQGVAEFESAVKALEQHYGAEHIETAAGLAALGEAYHAHNNHSEAQRCFSAALTIHSKCCGRHSPQAMHDLFGLAASLAQSGELQRATAECERALSMREQQVGGNFEDLAEMQFALAGMYIDWGNLGRARELILLAIGYFRRAGGKRFANALEALAELEAACGNLDRAVKVMDQAIKAQETESPSSLELVNYRQRREAMAARLQRMEGTPEAPPEVVMPSVKPVVEERPKPPSDFLERLVRGGRTSTRVS
jgi:tetratricopeptide (TPR) repeat protein